MRQHGQETTRRSNPEEKWQIVQEGMKSGNVSETCRRHGIAQTLYYRWKDEAEQGAKAALGGRAPRPRKPRRIVGSSSWNGVWDADPWKLKPKKRRRGVGCGEVHSQARALVEQGYAATVVAAALMISRSSLYYRKKPRGSRADRKWDEQIVEACGEKTAYGYRRVP
jgi:DNA invertase Pin-like site-specific DNA recombinase